MPNNGPEETSSNNTTTSAEEMRFDPLELLEELMDCLSDQSYSEAVTKVLAYYQWRLRGGFEPLVRGRKGDILAKECGMRLSDELFSLGNNARLK